MNRIRVEYGKAAVTTLCALSMVALCIIAHTLDALYLVVAFAGLTWYFVLKARVFSRARSGGCRPVR